MTKKKLEKISKVARGVLIGGLMVTLSACSKPECTSTKEEVIPSCMVLSAESGGGLEWAATRPKVHYVTPEGKTGTAYGGGVPLEKITVSRYIRTYSKKEIPKYLRVLSPGGTSESYSVTGAWVVKK